MKSLFSLSVGLSTLFSPASAHYIFQRLTYGGTEYPAYTYIRTNTNYNSPVIDLTSTDLRCNVGALTGGSTTTISVKAGDPFSFTTDTAVYHDGPLSIYMAKVPSGSTAATFDGSGQVWFKILDLGPTFSGGSSTWPLAQTYTYTIPPALPSGDYLLRVQQLAIHNPYPAGIPQFYISCAQITVSGSGTGSPSPLVSIPGFITGTEPGYVVNIYTDFTNYTVPGPAVWAGQSASGGTPPTSIATSATPTTATSPTSTKTTSSVVSTSTAALIPKYGQCGGQDWKGGTVCVAGSTCVANGLFYSQCL